MKINDINYMALCDNCLINEDTSRISIDDVWIFLCDECLQELNRKIAEHLAEKNL